MKLYTRKGDDGSTGLSGGDRVSKDCLRVRAYGAIDETNAAIGLCTTACRDEETLAILRHIQSDLFALGAELATRPGGKKKAASPLTESHVSRLERWIDDADAAVSPLANFILPGGGEAAVRLHFARTVCRRAEREIVQLSRTERVSTLDLAYVNRLSDLLFALARRVNHLEGVSDVPWKPTSAGPNP